MKRGVRPGGAPAVFLFALAAALLAAACGYKEAPIPPQRIVPKAIGDLRLRLGSDGATLTWSYPQQTVTGEKLVRISGFELYRAVVPLENYCEDCPIPFLPPVSLDGGALPDKGGRDGSYNEPVLRPGNLYFYKIRSRNGWFAESADSNVISFLWDTPAAAPADLKVEAVPGGRNQLSWTGVTKNQDDEAVGHPVRYQIFRQVNAGAFKALGKPTEDTGFIDTNLKSGATYGYKIQALSVLKDGLVEGGTSETVSITHVDKDAPPPPPTPEVLVTQQGIKVFWKHAEAEDLAGYRVYRRVADKGEAVLAGQVTLPQNIFIDKKAPDPRKNEVYYSVSSIDTEDPPNESPRSEEVLAEDLTWEEK